MQHTALGKSNKQTTTKTNPNHIKYRNLFPERSQLLKAHWNSVQPSIFSSLMPQRFEMLKLSHPLFHFYSGMEKEQGRESHRII